MGVPSLPRTAPSLWLLGSVVANARVIARVVTGVSVRILHVVWCGHVTLLVCVVDIVRAGDGCGGGMERVGGDIRGHEVGGHVGGVRQGAQFGSIMVGGSECALMSALSLYAPKLVISRL